MERIQASFSDIPVLYDCDVAVVGGGTAGCAAAIAAGRAGADTVLIERAGSVGGVPVLSSMGSMGNRLSDSEGNSILGGMPWEMLSALVEAGATQSRDMRQTLIGNIGVAFNMPFQPEAYAHIAFKKLREAGVKTLLHSAFVAAQTQDGRIGEVLIATKQGLAAVRARVFVDATGEADVAASAGAPTTREDFTWGNLMRLGNVDFEACLGWLWANPDFGRDEGFDAWLSGYLGMTYEEMKADRHWRHICGEVHNTHVPMGYDENTPEKIAWMKKRWQSDGVFYNIEMTLLRKVLRKAVEAGDLALAKEYPGFGKMWIGFDGFAGGAWGDGICLVNACSAARGFDASNALHVSLVESEGRIYCNEIAGFFRKYVPGFARSFLIDIGAQFTCRASRCIEGDCAVSAGMFLDIMRRYPDEAIYHWKGGELGVDTEGRMRYVGIPYRAIVPRHVENLYVAGKCAWGGRYMRSIVSCIAMGEAAGTGAAMLAKAPGGTAAGLDVKALQERLRAQGVLI